MMLVFYAIIVLIFFVLCIINKKNKAKFKEAILVYLPKRRFKIFTFFLYVFVLIIPMLIIRYNFNIDIETYITVFLCLILFMLRYIQLISNYIVCDKEKIIVNYFFKKKILLLKNITGIEIKEYTGRKYSEKIIIKSSEIEKKLEVTDILINYDNLKNILLHKDDLNDVVFNNYDVEERIIKKYNHKFHLILILITMLLLSFTVIFLNDENEAISDSLKNGLKTNYTDSEIKIIENRTIIIQDVFIILIGTCMINGLYFWLLWMKSQKILLKIIMILLIIPCWEICLICGIIKLPSLIYDIRFLYNQIG